jgi:hypothetical protein
MDSIPRALRRLAGCALAALALAVLTPGLLLAATVNLSWSSNSEPDLGGYIARYGTQPGVYTQQLDLGRTTQGAITDLTPGGRYYVSLIAYDLDGNLSAPSAEVTVLVPYADTTPPNVTLVQSVGPNTLLVTFSESIDLTQAGDPSNYLIDGIVQPLSAVVSADGQQVRLSIFTQNDGDHHTVTVTGITDLFNNAMPTSPHSYQVDLGLHVTPIAPADYRAVPLLPGTDIYVDAPETITDVAMEWHGATLIQTAQGDAQTDNPISFEVDRDAIVFVGYDPLAVSPPDWLTTAYLPVGPGPIGASGEALSMWARNTGPGTVTLGSNAAIGANGAQDQYLILVKAMDATSYQLDADGDGMRDAWERIVNLDTNRFNPHDVNADGFTHLQSFWRGGDPLANSIGPEAAGNRTPVAVIEPTVIATTGLPVTLDAASGFDPDGDPLSWGWSQVSGDPVALFGYETSTLTFTANQAGLYVFNAILSDGYRADARTVYVEVIDSLLASLANATEGHIDVAQGSLAGATLDIPLGGLDKPRQIAIGERDLPTPLPLGNEQMGSVLSFSPANVALSAPATIRVPYNSLAKAGSGETTLVLLRHDPATDEWIQISGTTQVNGTLEAQVSQLGSFVVASAPVNGNAAGAGGGCALLTGTSSGPGDVALLLLPLLIILLRTLSHRLRGVAAVACAILGLLLVTPSAQAASVPLSIANEHPFALQEEPVTSGIPFPKGGLPSTASVRLEDATGLPVPLQTTAQAHWSDGSVKWLLLDFQADLPASEPAAYTVHTGVSGGPSHPNPVLVDDTPDQVTITTGVATFRISKSRFNLFDEVLLGTTGIIAPGNNGGLFLTPSSAPAPVFGADISALLSDSLTQPPTVTVEAAGPLHATIKVSGTLFVSGTQRMGYTIRLHFYAGKSYLRAETRLENNTPATDASYLCDFGQPCNAYEIGKPGSISFDDFSLTLQPTLSGARSYTLGGEIGATISGNLGAGPVRLYQDSSGGDAWNRHSDAVTAANGWPSHQPRPSAYVSFRGYKMTQNGTELPASAGNRALGWIDSRGSGAGVTVAVADFWQNFPKALAADSGTVSAHLFPADFAKDHTFRVGEDKTHSVLIYFHDGTQGATAIEQRIRALNQPPFALAPPAWYADSGAVGPMAPVLPGGSDAYETMVRASVEPTNRNNISLLTKREQWDFYGWQDFGDIVLDYEGDSSGGNGHTNLKYNFDYGMLLQYLRGGDRRWLDLGTKGGRHLADQDILHARKATSIHWANDSYFGHSYHSQQGHTNPNRNTGGLSINVAYGPPGLFLNHFLTGDLWVLEGANAISESVKWRVANNHFIIGDYNTTFGTGQGYIGSRARTYANGLWILTEAYNATGDLSYLDVAEVLIDAYYVTHVPWLQPGNTIATKPWQESNYLYALGRYLDTINTIGRSDALDATGHLLTVADYLIAEAYIPWSAGDDPTIGGYPYETNRAEAPESAVRKMGNWNTLGADALAYAAKYGPVEKRRLYMEHATKLWRFGTRFPIQVPMDAVNWTDTYALTYFSAKEAMNATVWGNVYLSELRRTPPLAPVQLSISAP